VVPSSQPSRITVREPDLSTDVLPSQDLQWQVDSHGLIGLHQWRSTFGITEYQQLGWSKGHGDRGGPGRMVDPSKDRNVFCL
jgi:hypothetical protein